MFFKKDSSLPALEQGLLLKTPTTLNALLDPGSSSGRLLMRQERLVVLFVLFLLSQSQIKFGVTPVPSQTRSGI